MQLSPSQALEAVLFAAGEPMTKRRLAGLFEVTTDLINAAAAELRENLADRGVVLVETEDELELRTAPSASAIVKKLRESELSKDLGKAGLEALAIILYQGSATRGEIDWIRGVNSSAAVRSLLIRGLIERTEDESDKRRARYTTSVDALAHLGITRKEDLPEYAEVSAALVERSEPTTDHDT
jgi:segregation and condensation protein B